MVETKVKASTAAAALSGMALWALGRYVFKGDVPDVVVSWVDVIIPAGLAFGAGYWAKHTVRPGDPPAAAPIAAPATRGGYSAGDMDVSDMPLPPQHLIAQPPQATAPPAQPPAPTA
jgi:hypothetical protein